MDRQEQTWFTSCPCLVTTDHDLDRSAGVRAVHTSLFHSLYFVPTLAMAHAGSHAWVRGVWDEVRGQGLQEEVKCQDQVAMSQTFYILHITSTVH
jgi:hypothetical protein